MIFALIGKVIATDNFTIQVKDLATERVQDIILDSQFPLEIGAEGIFIGSQTSDGLVAKRIELRKFLDPLYEGDLIATSGKYNLVTPINNPFPELYKRLIEIQEKENQNNDQETLN